MTAHWGLRAVALAAMFLLPTAAAQNPIVRLAQDRTLLLGGVEEIAAPGAPGTVLAWGERAFPVVAGEATQKLSLPVVAAARFGTGRIVLFGHDGYADAKNAAVADTAQLLANAIEWSAGDKFRPVGSTRVGMLGCDLTALLTERKLQPEKLGGPDWSTKLGDLDVVLCFTTKLTSSEVQALRRFVREGRGLLCGGTGWGWRQLNQDKPLRECALNDVLDGSGLFLADGTLDRTGKTGFVVPAAGADALNLCNGSTALALLEKHAVDPAGIEPRDLSQAGLTLTRVAQGLPQDDDLLRPKLRKLLSERGGELRPTEATPLRVTQALPRVLLAFQLAELEHVEPAKLDAHPAAADFPGSVPSDAPKVTREVEIDGRVPDWHSTGLYAPPGEAIQVQIGGESAKAGISLRIGAHADENWHHAEWTRVPEITLQRPLRGGTHKFASAFGGLIYVVVPQNCTVEKLRVRISQAVEAPRFVLGVTKPAEWKRLRSAPGPWAEFESSKVIVTVPSTLVRNVEDPTAVLELWDRVLDAAADLATIPRERRRPERYVADRQISAGYMHSGYPIMTHLDAADDMVIFERLKKGNWGLFHEMGHNHQSGDWTFDGTGEVTCNLFSLYILEKVCNVPTNAGHDGVRDPSRSIERYVRGGAKFEQWKADPFLALAMYVQLQQAFGWDVFKSVFTEYRALPDAERPKNDDQKRDQWMIRMSRATGRNLGPFFEAWGVPTSPGARRGLTDLPEWMPEGWPKK